MHTLESFSPRTLDIVMEQARGSLAALMERRRLNSEGKSPYDCVVVTRSDGLR